MLILVNYRLVRGASRCSIRQRRARLVSATLNARDETVADYAIVAVYRESVAMGTSRLGAESTSGKLGCRRADDRSSPGGATGSRMRIARGICPSFSS